MKKTIILFLIGLISLNIANAYTISGDAVYINDSRVYLETSPSIMTGSGYVYQKLNSKLFTGNIDFAIGVNGSSAQMTSFEVYTNITDVNGTYEGWKSFNLTQLNYIYDGKDVWYVGKNMNVVAGKEYQARFYLNLVSGTNGKYDIAIKPSAETIAQSIANNHFYMLDPWWNSTSGGDYPLNNNYWIFINNGSSTVNITSSGTLLLNKTGADYNSSLNMFYSRMVDLSQNIIWDDSINTVGTGYSSRWSISTTRGCVADTSVYRSYTYSCNSNNNGGYWVNTSINSSTTEMYTNFTVESWVYQKSALHGATYLELRKQGAQSYCGTNYCNAIMIADDSNMVQYTCNMVTNYNATPIQLNTWHRFRIKSFSNWTEFWVNDTNIGNCTNQSNVVNFSSARSILWAKETVSTDYNFLWDDVSVYTDIVPVNYSYINISLNSSDTNSSVRVSANNGVNWTSWYTSANNGQSLPLTVAGSQLMFQINLIGGTATYSPVVYSFGLVNSSVVSISESSARTAIETGINNALSTKTIYYDQRIYTYTGIHNFGKFDIFVVSGNKRWAFNYLTGNETYTNMQSIGTTLNVWENISLTTNQITEQVQALINFTKG